MIWIGICLLVVLALAPAAFVVLRARTARNERDSALALHRAQLDELDRDLASGLIVPAEHVTAQLEVQRRLLAADAALDEQASLGRRRIGAWLAIGLVPLAAVALYLTEGHPMLPAQPLAPRLAALHKDDTRTDDLLARLRAGLARMEPGDPNLVQGYLLLGQAEAAREHYAAAAKAWRMALDQNFDPELAARIAEAQTRADGRVSPDSADLFRRALDAAPKDAQWRMAAEQRIAESEHGQ